MRFLVLLSIVFTTISVDAKECESDTISKAFNELANFVVEKELPGEKYLIRVNAPKQIENATFDFMGYGLELSGRDALGLDMAAKEVEGYYQSYVSITKDTLSKSSFTVMYSTKPNSPGSCTYTYWVPNNITIKSTTPAKNAGRTAKSIASP